jgi:hypothetical protein
MLGAAFSWQDAADNFCAVGEGVFGVGSGLDLLSNFSR